MRNIISSLFGSAAGGGGGGDINMFFTSLSR